MKLAAIYNTFDGEELLEGSISQIYSLCHEVIVVWQEQSNMGQMHPALAAHLLALQKRWPNIRLIKYVPDFTLSAGNNERNKRTLGLNRSRALGCSHFLFMDNDEYYHAEQIKQAMQKIEREGFDATACRLYTYFKQPTYRLVPMEQYWVPFICQIKPEQRVGQGFPVYADPTRGIAPVAHFHAFDKSEVAMHHFSYVRHNLRRKLENSTARPNFGNIDQLLQRIEAWHPGLQPPVYLGHTVEEVEDVFGVVKPIVQTA